jgi:hypothetical protein
MNCLFKTDNETKGAQRGKKSQTHLDRDITWLVTQCVTVQPLSSCFCRVIFLLAVNSKLCNVTHNACGGVDTGLKLGL